MGCYISLDLKNMFNEISRDKILQVIRANFPECSPWYLFFILTLSSSEWQMAHGTLNPWQKV